MASSLISSSLKCAVREAPNYDRNPFANVYTNETELNAFITLHLNKQANFIKRKDNELNDILAGYLYDPKPVIRATITGTHAQNIVIGVGNTVSSAGPSLGKRHHNIADKGPLIDDLPKRQRKQVVHDDFVNSEIISDEEGDANSDLCLSESSYVLSDNGEVLCGYICKLGMPELEAGCISGSPMGIMDSELAAMVADTHQLVTTNSLIPSDLENRMRVSGIFLADGDAVDVTTYLPNNISLNVLEFKRAIQGGKFFKQHVVSEDINELALNNILASTYLLHGKERIKTKGSELNLIASSVYTFISPFFSAHDTAQMEFDAVSWVYKQGKKMDEDKLRPDILIHAKQHGKIIEIGCGEVKNVGISADKLNRDKARVLEIMKRQLHVRLRYAKSQREAVTFGIVVRGMSVILLRMTMDLDKGVYFFYEQPQMTLPTTYETYSHMDTSMELMYNFKFTAKCHRVISDDI